MENYTYLNTNQLSELKRLIELLKIKIKTKGSLSLDLIKKQKKNVQNFFKETWITRKDINLTNLELQNLIEKRILSILSAKEEKYSFTMKGLFILDYEIINPNSNVEKLLDELNKVYFDDIMELSKESLTNTEKAIILSLLGLAAISTDKSLRVDERNEAYFKKAVDTSASFLKNLGSEYEDGSLEKLWNRNVTGEGPILGELRRLNNIQPRTEGLCKRLKDGTLYLDIIQKTRIDEGKLTYLLKRIFDKKPLTFENKKELINCLDFIQRFEFYFFKIEPNFDLLEVKKQIKRCIQSDL